MKKKTKIIASVEIAIVLCSVFLVALPATAIAAEQDDYVLGVYGNANEDDTIDMRDLTYVKLIFFGKKPETELADAKYDGKVNPLDFIQIKLIIVGKEKELTIIDTIAYHSSLSGKNTKRSVTVKKPVNRVIVTYYDPPQILRALNAEDTIVGIGKEIQKETVAPLFPKIRNLPCIGESSNPDFEEILNLQPDIIVPGMGGYWKAQYMEKTLGVTVLYLPLTGLTEYENSILKFGYILDKEEEAEEILQWRERWLNMVKERTEGLSEDKKPRVLVLSHFKPAGEYKTWSEDSFFTVMCGVAGGKSILPEDASKGATVDPEWVAEQNPDIIFAHTIRVDAGYGTDDPSELIACREELMNRPELAEVTAVKEGKVYLFSGLSLSGTGALFTAQYMAKSFHPDLFEDVGIKECHQEWLDNFQHIDYDLQNHGIFIYPEVS